MINQRLFDHFSIDTTKNLGLRATCPRPFDTVLVDRNGSCFVCECSSWLPQSIGNLQISELGDLLNNATHAHLKQSIKDGTYRYCNEKHCSYLLDDRPQDKFKGETADRVKFIRLGLDDSCNLRCPSCRTQKIFLSSGVQLRRKMMIIDKLVNFITQNGDTHVHVGSDGDPFVSLVYRYFFRKIRPLENVTLSLQTNGLLIKKMYQRNRDIFDKLTELNVSIDGASQQTYESLRVGGNWSILRDNLEFLQSIKKDHRFKIVFHYVIQRANYTEMTDMVHMAEHFRADKVWLNKITDWNTMDNFPEHDVTNANNVSHLHYRSELMRVRGIANEVDVKVEMPTLGHET